MRVESGALSTLQYSAADLQAIESHYQSSSFVAEVCIVPFGDRELRAVVVPDLAVLRQRRVVNLKELIRFELEGLSIFLPPDQRIAGFEILLAPLPRTPEGHPDRSVILERYRTGRLRARDSEPDVHDEHTARVIALVQRIVATDAPVTAASNLELDLGLDSMDRVELLASLEQCFGTRLPEEVWRTAFCVQELADGFRGSTPTQAAPPRPWALLLETRDAPAGWRALLKRRTLTAAAVYLLVRLVLRPLLRARARGLDHLPRNGPFIISPNHQSYIDPLIVESVLPFGLFRQLFFVGAAEYFENPIAAWLARRLNIVPVDPDANLIGAMQAAAFGLRHDKVLVLFPEGERSIDGSVKTFRNGAAVLAAQLRVPIVPVAINGAFDVWPRNRPIGWRRLQPWSGHRVTVSFGRPIDPPPPGRTAAEHTAAVRRAVEQLWVAAESAASRDLGF